MFVFYMVFVAIATFFVAYQVAAMKLGLIPDIEALLRDLAKLSLVVDIEAYVNRPRCLSHVKRYYEQTSFRDYMILKWIYGADLMHTVLGRDCSSSLLYVVSHLRSSVCAPPRSSQKRAITWCKNDHGCDSDSSSDSSSDCTETDRSTSTKHYSRRRLQVGGHQHHDDVRQCRVFEIGYGKGVNALHLASVFKDIEVMGVDIAEEHRSYATNQAVRMGVSNRTRFYAGDAGNPPEETWKQSYNIIFGIESFCHFDTAEQRDRVLLMCRTQLKDNGKLIIVDGSRCENHEFASLDSAVQTSMRLSESGFQIGTMPTRKDWKEACSRHGLVFEQETDLTQEAARFWIRWWKVAHVLLTALPVGVLKWIRQRAPSTFDNFVSVCMTGYAFYNGGARYGVLVFRKKNNSAALKPPKSYRSKNRKT